MKTVGIHVSLVSSNSLTPPAVANGGNTPIPAISLGQELRLRRSPSSMVVSLRIRNSPAPASEGDAQSQRVSATRPKTVCYGISSRTNGVWGNVRLSEDRRTFRAGGRNCSSYFFAVTNRLFRPGRTDRRARRHPEQHQDGRLNRKTERSPVHRRRSSR